MNNKPFTLKEINDALGNIEPKIVHVNQKTYDAMLPLLDFEPINVVINNYLPNNQAMVLPDTRKDVIRYRVVNDDPDDFTKDDEFWLVLHPDGRTTKIPRY